MKFIRSRNSPLYSTGKMFVKYFCFIYLITSNNAFKEEILNLFPFVIFMSIVPGTQRKGYTQRGTALCHKNGATRNSYLDCFNSASVWLFILSIETFFSCTLKAQKNFFTFLYHFAQTNGVCVLYERMCLFSFSHLRTSLVYQSARPVTQCARKSHDYRSLTAVHMDLKNPAYSYKPISKITKCLFNLTTHVHCSCGNTYCTINRRECLRYELFCIHW